MTIATVYPLRSRGRNLPTASPWGSSRIDTDLHPERGTPAYAHAVDDLVKSLRQTRPPVAHGVPDEPRPPYPFASDGTLTNEVRIAGIGGRA